MKPDMTTKDTLNHLRHQLALLEHEPEGHPSTPFDFGLGDNDNASGTQLARGALHEIFAAEPDDMGAAAGFVSALARRAAPARPVLWARNPDNRTGKSHLYGAGLPAFGLNPAELILVELTEAADLLRAGLEAARCAALGAVILESWGMPKLLDFTATRRLALATSRSGVTLFLLRINAHPQHSAARTRWQVAAGASRPLAVNAPGRPTFDITLLRHRTGTAGRNWHLEWDHEQFAFRYPPRPAPLSLPVVSLPLRRPVSPPGAPTRTPAATGPAFPHANARKVAQ